MANHDKSKLSIRHLGPRKLLLAGIPFFVAGALLATGFHGTKTLSAGDTVAAENRVIESPAMPTSFAELADNLSPSVVNVLSGRVSRSFGVSTRPWLSANFRVSREPIVWP